MIPDPFVQVSAGYDAWSSTYDHDSNPMIAMAHRALADRLPGVAGWRVLELGCGTGRNAAPLLAANVAQYVGVDGSAGMLAQARRRIDDPRATWVEGDLLDASLVSGRFDLVLFSLVLEHIAVLAPAFARAAAAAAPGGLIVALEIHPGLRAGGTQAHYVVDGEDIPIASYPHTVDGMRSAVAEAGLELVATVDRYPTSLDIERCGKLAKHRGRPVLLEVAAQRPRDQSGG